MALPFLGQPELVGVQQENDLVVHVELAVAEEPV
jgi:hypothetical protein